MTYFTRKLIKTWHTIEVERSKDMVEVYVTNRHGFVYSLCLRRDGNYWEANDCFGNNRKTLRGAIEIFFASIMKEVETYDKLAHEGLNSYSHVSWNGKDVYCTVPGLSRMLEGYDEWRNFKLKQ